MFQRQENNGFFFSLPNISIVSSMVNLGNSRGIACGSALETDDDIGEWLYPDGSSVRVFERGDPLYFLTRINHVVLHSRRDFITSLEGIYTCRIPNENSVMQSLYVGIYTDETFQGDGQFEILWVIHKPPHHATISMVTLPYRRISTGVC